MPFFQNPFEDEFRGSWILDDRALNPTFRCPGNTGRGNDVIYAWNAGTYDTTGTDDDGVNNNELTVRFAHGPSLRLWASITISLTDNAAVTAEQVVTDLNADNTFSSYFIAELVDDHTTPSGPNNHVSIRSTLNTHSMMRFFVTNNGAETILGFNVRAGVSELPTYFDRHTVDQVLNFESGTGMLVPLGHRIESVTSVADGVITSTAHGLANSQVIVIANSDTDLTLDGVTRTVASATTDTFVVGVNTSTTGGTRGVWMTLVEQDVIEAAVDFRGTALNFVATAVQDDYELISGRGAQMIFLNNTVDGSDRITRQIEYSAGSSAGDLARLHTLTYSGADLTPTTHTIEPYVLLSGDLITPY